MALRFFTVSIHDATSVEDQVNAFLRSHKVLSVDRRFVEQGTSSFWAICVDYLDGAQPTFGGRGGTVSSGRAKVDYREVLSPEDFAVFVQLRQWRKEIAAAEAVPVYLVFTNEQLAEIVRRKVTSKAALGQIEGVGEARVQKYGERVLEVLSSTGNSHAASRPVV